MINTRVWVNGEQTDSLPASDRGLQYGDGVWETIAVREGRAIQLDAHLLRLKRGLKALSIMGVDAERLKQEIIQQVGKEKQCILKVIVTRGSGGRGYSPKGCDQPTRILSLHPWPEYPASYAQQGVAITLCESRLSHNPRLAGFKHLNRLEQVLARAELGSAYQEGLVRDQNGSVIEATMSNLFVVKKDTTIVTPDLSACGIEGVARSCIIAELQRMHIKISVETVTVDDVEQAQGLFLSNSIMKIWPVKQFQAVRYAVSDNVKALQKRIEVIL